MRPVLLARDSPKPVRVAMALLEVTLTETIAFFGVSAMRIGYARISEEDRSLPVQRQTLLAAGCGQVDEERGEGQTTRRSRRDVCPRPLRAGDPLVVWQLDPLGRSLSDLIQSAADLQARGNPFGLAERTTPHPHPAGQVPMRAIAARSGVTPSTLYRSNLAELPGADPS